MPEAWLPNPAPYPPVPPSAWPPEPPRPSGDGGADQPPLPPSGDHWKVALIVLAAGVVAVLVAVSAIALLKPRSTTIEQSTDVASLPGSTTTTVPVDQLTEVSLRDEVDQMVDFVERKRKLAFTTPPSVVLLGAPEFSAAWGRYVDEYFVAIARRLQTPFDALSLAPQGSDLARDTTEWMGDSAAVFYDPTLRRVVVREGPADSFFRYQLAEALTRALDAQHHDLSLLSLPKGFGDPQFGLWSLLAPDSTNIAMQWGGTLPFDEQRRLVGELTRRQPGARAGSDFPDAWKAWLDGPDTDAKVLYSQIIGQGGFARLDKSFDEPPAGSAQALDFRRYLGGSKPGPLTAPTAPQGAKVIDQGSLGMLFIRASMGDHVASDKVTVAMNVYDTDATVAYRLDGRSCVRVRLAALPEHGVEGEQALADVAKMWATDLGGSVTAVDDPLRPGVSITEATICGGGGGGSGQTPGGAGPGDDTGSGSGI